MAALQDKVAELLDRWREEIQRLPVPAHVQLVDGEPGERLRRLASALLEVAEDAEASSRFQPGGDAYREAEELGRLRRQQGFSMELLVQEHVIMRNEFWNLFHESVEMKRVVDFHLEKRVNNSCDLLLQAAASAYHYQSSKEIMENPLRDPLTGLYNQSYFQGRMIEELRRSVRYKRDITLVLLELGNYYHLLEKEGRETIERALKYIGHCLSRMTRDCDVVARLGEGSFAALLPETGWRGGKVMAERLSRYFQRELDALFAGDLHPELSWGLASFPDEVSQPEKLYPCAVEAMRASRSLPRGEIAVYRGSRPQGGD
ncbi:MAG: diguanylate cyclase [Actinobacteria bacterium]|nr:diguanylate cyclase [Actinomycetota bacterium]